ncbi:MAG: enoyl-CoA hydratase/isomerase family protein [Spirochaetaceae bacterium]|nr:enoyl-CoA hydratase/isomerase family protein [Myxococcales bacterium]MCB9724574.1 enoyl-CoA hydratase/isomerase family protein [Spirochaetaceae bacterium]HPG26061.1 enoyl-CoA hydratase/isomerase family protein [Myxococcota bacterium]
MSRSERIRETRDGGVVTLHFADPDRLNAMTREMGEAFRDRIAGLAADDSIRALVLTGEGRAFSAGGDLDMLQAKADQGAAAPGVAWRAIRDEMASFYRLFLSLRDLACPTIAAINGHAIGAGLCVALGCDLRFVAREARLGLNFTRLGVHPGMAATWNLPRLVGPAVAAELLYTSRLIDGEEAGRIGLANRVLPAAEVLEAARATAAEIAANAPLAVRATKQALRRTESASIEDQLQFEASEQARHFESRDVHEGLAAIREKRAPRFEGR